jgi:putative transcriptional regulator
LNRCPNIGNDAAMEEGNWSDGIRGARRAAGLTQRALAELTGISLQTVRAYERRRRHPSRAHLVAMLDVLRTERGERNRILSEAGFAPDGMALRPPVPDLLFSEDEAAREIERYGWPVFVTDEFARMVGANQPAQRLWRVDLSRELLDPAERNMLTALANPRIADHIANWDEVASVVASVFKGHHRGGEDIEQPSPYFRAVLDRFAAGDARYVSRFAAIWRDAPAPPHKTRWSYEVAWRHPHGLLRFQSFASSANEPDGLAFHDWIPLDGATWAALDHDRAPEGRCAACAPA